MKFAAIMLGMVALGTAIGFAVPTSGLTDGEPKAVGAVPAAADSAGDPAAGGTETEPGRHLFDYRRVVHAYREDVDAAARENLRLMAERKGHGGAMGEVHLASGADGSLRLVRTTPEGARITIDFLVRSQGEDAVVTARVFVDMASRSGALGYVPDMVADGVDWAQFAPRDAIRADVENFISRIERQASRYRAAMEAGWDRRNS